LLCFEDRKIQKHQRKQEARQNQRKDDHLRGADAHDAGLSPPIALNGPVHPRHAAHGYRFAHKPGISAKRRRVFLQ
jgi:hypothetical protein